MFLRLAAVYAVSLCFATFCWFISVVVSKPMGCCRPFEPFLPTIKSKTCKTSNDEAPKSNTLLPQPLRPTPSQSVEIFEADANKQYSGTHPTLRSWQLQGVASLVDAKTLSSRHSQQWYLVFKNCVWWFFLANLFF